MAALRLSDQVRDRIKVLLADDRGDFPTLLSSLEQLSLERGIDVHAAALELLANLRIPEPHARRLLLDLGAHRDRLTAALGRDPGLRVAAIDYLANVKKLLANPAIVESTQFERTRRSAVTDPLTRLYNRRFFARALALEVRRSHRYSLKLSLLMLDLDAFKRLNDQHGHLFGDLVLQRVGQILRRAVREADTPSRYGGEEFAVILPETDRLGGYAVAERIREGVVRGFHETPVGGRLVRVRISGGIASYPVDGEDPQQLIARADKALYLAKERGKDRISLYHSERREAIRYPARRGSQARIERQPDGTALRARPLNVSRTGALFDLEVELDPAARLLLRFSGRDGDGRPCEWTVGGQVVRIEDRGVTGDAARVAVRFERPLPDECLHQHVLGAGALRAVQGGRA